MSLCFLRRFSDSVVVCKRRLSQHDENKFSMKAFTLYIEELQSYETVLHTLKEAALTVSPVLSGDLMF
jgi:hypothetical protein